MAQPKSGIIDSHVHIWDRTCFHYHWMTPDSPLDRDISLNEIDTDFRTFDVRGGLLMEAANTPDEIEWLLSTAESDSRHWGVVGWIDLDKPDAPYLIEKFGQHPCFKGVRLNWLTPRSDVNRLIPALSALADHHLILDILAHPDQLPAISAFVRHHPHMTFILDHFAGWALTAKTLNLWCSEVASLAALKNCFMKVSGYASVDPTTLRAYLRAADALFGVHRLMFGSNTPFCPDGYSAALTLVQTAAADQPNSWHDAFFSKTALSVYHLASKSE